jgi:hypothetical protein
LIHGAALFAVIDIEPLRMHCISISRIARGEMVTLLLKPFPGERANVLQQLPVIHSSERE